MDDNEMIPLGVALARLRLSGARPSPPTLEEIAREREAIDALMVRVRVRQLVSSLCREAEHLRLLIARSHGREQLMREMSADQTEIDDERSLRRGYEADREENTAALERVTHEIEEEFS